jgi:hypothetical protein
VRPERRGQPAAVFLSELAGPGRVAEHRLKELGVDDQAGLQEVEREHGDLGVLAVVAGDDALAAVVDLVVGGVPVLDDLQPAVDLAAQLLIGEVGEDRPYRAAELFEREVDGVLGAAALGEAAQHLVGLGGPQPQGGGVLDHVVVVPGYQVPVWAFS